MLVAAVAVVVVVVAMMIDGSSVVGLGSTVGIVVAQVVVDDGVDVDF